LANASYECLFIFDSNHYARDPGGIASSVQSMIGDLGGEILVSRLWAEQRLAYQIKGHSKGTYWLAIFNLDSLKLKELNRTCQLNDSLLRHMFTRLDDRLVNVLVAHALEKVVVPIDQIERVGAVAAVGADEEEEGEVEEGDDE
jgi:small subunit ribosomal protein S6